MTETIYFAHVPSAAIEEVSTHLGMAASLSPRADVYGSPGCIGFLNALRNVCASAVLQCSGSKRYGAMAARNRAWIAADRQAEGRMLDKLNRRASRINRMVA